MPADDFIVVRNHQVQICAADRVLSDQTLKKGRHLSLARRKLAPDDFDRWLSTLGIPAATAALLERASELFGTDGNAEHLHAGAMLLLAGDGVPWEAISAARATARGGRVVTYAFARALVDRYTPATAPE